MSQNVLNLDDFMHYTISAEHGEVMADIAVIIAKLKKQNLKDDDEYASSTSKDIHPNIRTIETK